ncbi:MAG: sugar ABC transporter permease [Nitrososphaeria archaeon]
MSKLIRGAYPYLYFLPILPFFLGILVYPWMISLYYSFQYYKPSISQETKFVGISNYIKLITDTQFHHSLFVTFYFVILAVSLEFLFGLGIALLLDRQFKLKQIVTTLILIPMMVAPSFAALSMKQFFDPLLGLFNFILRSIGLTPLNWLGDPNLSILVIVFIDVWQNTSFVALILLAGLQAIPVTQLEAAVVDGANSWAVFRHIKLPFIKPLILLAILFRTIFSLRVFETVLITFSETGGPLNAAYVLGLYLYWTGFKIWDFGLASALSWVMLLITLSVTLLLIYGLYREIEL